MEFNLKEWILAFMKKNQNQICVQFLSPKIEKIFKANLGCSTLMYDVGKFPICDYDHLS